MKNQIGIEINLDKNKEQKSDENKKIKYELVLQIVKNILPSLVCGGILQPCHVYRIINNIQLIYCIYLSINIIDSFRRLKNIIDLMYLFTD